MKPTSNKPPKASKKSKNSKNSKKSNLEEAQKKLDEFIELLKSNKDKMSEDIKTDLEYLIKMCVLSGKVSDASKKQPKTKEERLAKLKEIEKVLAIQDSPLYKYDTRHVNRLMRLLDVDMKTAKSISATEKMRNNLHVPYVENALDKTMTVEFNIYNSCVSAINETRNDENSVFTMKKAKQSIDKELKEIRKVNPKIIGKWKISSKNIGGSDYIYVDVDYNTTLNTHRHVFKLNPEHYVASSQFFDDTKTETLGDASNKND